MNQKGIAQVVVVLIILAGLALGVYLIGQKTFFKPKASLDATRVEIFGPTVKDGKTTSRNVKLRLVYVPPTPVSAPVTPTTAPSPQGEQAVTYNLYPGDNFIGLPFDYSFTSYVPSRLLSDTGGKCNAIWTTYANEGKMLVYPAGVKVTNYFTGAEVPDSQQGVIGNLAGGNGYFIRCSGSTTVTITAKPLSVDEAFRMIGYQKDPNNYPLYVAAPFNNQNLGASRVKALDLLNKISRGSFSCTEVLTPRVICTTSGEACSISGVTSYRKNDVGNFTLRDDTGYAVKCTAAASSPLPICPSGVDCFGSERISDLDRSCSDKPLRCVSSDPYNKGINYCCKNPTPVSGPVPIGVQGVAKAQGAYPTHFRVSNRKPIFRVGVNEYEFRGNPTEIDWELSSGDGIKDVYAEFKLNGAWGNRVSASVELTEPIVSAPVTPTPTPIVYAPTPRPTASPSQSPIPTTTPTAPPVACSVCSADINKDGVVTIIDFSTLQSCFNKKATDTKPSGGTCAAADINGDGVVTILDYSCLTSKFNQRCEANLTTQPKVSTKTVVNNPPTITTNNRKYFFFTFIQFKALDADKDNINLSLTGVPQGSFGPYCSGSSGTRTCNVWVRGRDTTGIIKATATDGKDGTATTSVNLPLR